MKCIKCHSPSLCVLDTREKDGGIIARRRECNECGARFTTHELPPGAYNMARSDINRWIARQVGDWKTKIRQREKQAKKMCELRIGGATATEVARLFNISVHMAYWYTNRANMQKFGFTTTEVIKESKK